MNGEQKSGNASVMRGVMRWALRETMGMLMYLPLLFWSAGTWDWPMAWALIGLTALWVIGTAAVTIPRYPELLAERVGPRKGVKTWDIAILGAIGVLMLVKLLLAGFNRRNNWTGELPFWSEVAGLLTALAGYALVVWATGSNAYFSMVNRIQVERGHKVAAGGPYRFVRHPAYVGMILAELGTSLMLGSWPALIPGVISSVLILARTALEDHTLLNELDGYVEFAQITRYRLVPGIW